MLLTILDPKTGIPTISAAWMQRCALNLSAYRYDIVFKSTGEHGNADSLSRFLLPQHRETSPDPMVPLLWDRFRHYQ